jgi:hypothetical protein
LLPAAEGFSVVDSSSAWLPTGATSRTKSLHSWFNTASPFNRNAFLSKSTGVSGCSMMRKIVLGSETANAHALALPPRSRRSCLSSRERSSADANSSGTGRDAKLVRIKRESPLRRRATPLRTCFPKSMPTTESARFAMMLQGHVAGNVPRDGAFWTALYVSLWAKAR